eukprot:scaffold53585_cov21-Tisochrysis_lutea.AAC.2
MWWWETGSQMQAIWVTTEVPAWRAARSIQADRRTVLWPEAGPLRACSLALLSGQTRTVLWLEAWQRCARSLVVDMKKQPQNKGKNPRT